MGAVRRQPVPKRDRHGARRFHGSGGACGRLVDEAVYSTPDPVAAPGYSRREAAIRLARIGGAALAAPLVYSVDVGSAAAGVYI